MKISTVVGGAIVFVAGVGTGLYTACKAAVKLDEKIYKGKLREKFVEATTEATTSFLYKKFEPKRFESKKFEYSRFNSKPSFHTPNEVMFESRDKAEEILSTLNDLFDEYGSVTVADFYDLVDVNHSYIDTKYGWTEAFKDDMTVRMKDHYIINFPVAKEL